MPRAGWTSLARGMATARRIGLSFCPASERNLGLSVSQALQKAAHGGLDRIDAQLLLLGACGRSTSDRVWLLANGDAAIDEARFNGLLQRRLAGEPMAYILGSRGFYGLELHVDARVLDPRPDTETLVDWALELPLAADALVVDLGTGSGAVALALASQRAGWRVHATDLSADALDVARGNAQRLGLAVQLHQGAWFEALGLRYLSPNGEGVSLNRGGLIGPSGEGVSANGGSRFDLIVSNPPYIAEGDEHLAKLTHEPAIALTSGADGLDAIRHIVSHAPDYLQPRGWLLVEHGYDQAEMVRALLLAAGFSEVQSRKDLGGIERCSGGCL